MVLVGDHQWCLLVCYHLSSQLVFEDLMVVVEVHVDASYSCLELV